MQTLTCGPEDIEAGGERSVTVSTTTTPNDCGLLDNLEVGFEPDGTIHLVPHLTRDPDPIDAAQVEAVLTQAVDDECPGEGGAVPNAAMARQATARADAMRLFHYSTVYLAVLFIVAAVDAVL